MHDSHRSNTLPSEVPQGGIVGRVRTILRAARIDDSRVLHLVDGDSSDDEDEERSKQKKKKRKTKRDE